MSAPSRCAVSRIRSVGTITPRSITSKLLHWSTTPTMFLPMSCTSPLTVASTILPFERARLARLAIEVRHQVRDRLLHDARRLHDLRQEHLAGAEQVADDVHAVHQRAFDHGQRPPELDAGRVGVLGDELVDALDQRVLEALRHRPGPPGVVLGTLLAGLALEAPGDLEQPLGRIRAPRQDHVLDALAQLRLDLLVDRELPGVDDAHRHAGADRVVQEHRVHRLAHRLVAAERERHVAHAAAHQCVRAGGADLRRGLDEVERVAVVLPRCRSPPRRCSDRR